jgi:hypothetical protein
VLAGSAKWIVFLVVRLIIINNSVSDKLLVLLLLFFLFLVQVKLRNWVLLLLDLELVNWD